MKTKSCILAATLLFAATLAAFAQPTITRQPADFSVSLGANLTFTVIVTSTNPLSYQWWFNEAELAGATNRSLVLTNVQLINAGGYSVIVTDSSGSVTSRVAKLEVDPTFTKITTGPVVTDGDSSWAVAWGDYDNDGLIDLVVAENQGPNFLYRNTGNGTFIRITGGPTLSNGGAGHAWGDFDNDGDLDLFAAGYAGNPHRLYRNNGDGSFTKLTSQEAGSLVTTGGNGNAPSLADYDNDGYLDVLMTNWQQPNELYHGSASGLFTRVTSSPIRDGITSVQGAWADYDNDGDLDLLVTNSGEPQPGKSFYRNDGSGTFIKLDPSALGSLIDQDGGKGLAWADYDNDGDLDVFVCGHRGQSSTVQNALYRNDGNGKFERMTTNQVGSIVSGSMGNGAVWADYDNDGYLDLFVTLLGRLDDGGSPNRVNSLYHNNGDGTFSTILTGSLVHDLGLCFGAAWGDYDNDGFMDLAVANGGFIGGGLKNFLYRNNGNSNHWLKLKLEGTVSNRSAIGAKVRLRATIRGAVIWQMREISGGDGLFSQGDMRPNFGLGNATNAEIVRIEWPSGTVQELHNVAVNQILTVTEPPKLEPSVTLTNGLVELKVKSWKGFVYDIEASNDLKLWSRLTTLTNETGTLSFPDPQLSSTSQRFYRAVAGH